MSGTLTVADVEALCAALNRGLWGGRLPAVKVHWDDNPHYAARVDPRTGLLWLNPSEANRSRRGLVALLCHELGHVATRTETEEHGVRWQAAMRRCGLDPANGAIKWGGPLDRWLAERGW